MKKTISILLAVFMSFALAACGSQRADNAPSGTDAFASSSDASPPQPTEGDTDITASAPGGSAQVLVACFSATNTTKPLAEYVADSLNADLYEITPVEPYSSDDLNYRNDDSRSTKEMNDPNSRPAISGSVENMDQYSIVFIAYPIWWGEAPRIVSTFMESYDFSGKTIIPFCTSGGSGMGASGTNLEKLTSGATWLSGQRFAGGNSRDDMVSWVNSLGLDVTAK